MRIDTQKLAQLEPEARAEAEQLLAELNKAHEANPLLRYYPLGHQHRFHTAQTKVKMLAAGNRAGKTCAGVVDDLIQCCDSEALPERLRPYKKWEPPFFGRIVAPKFNENHEGVIFPTIRQWVPRNQLIGNSWEEAFSKQRRMLYFSNGSWLQFLTFEQDLDAFAGAALHRVHFDEEPDGDKGLAIFRENIARLIDHNGDFLITLTPLFGLSWSYEEIYEKRHSDRITVIGADMTENTHIDQAEVAEFLATLTDVERKARKEGRYVHFGGLFYDEFNDADHVTDSPKPEDLKEQSIVVGIDPGLNRTGVVWVAFDNDNAGLVFDEVYPSQYVVGDVAKLIHQTNRKWGISPDYYVIDPSARNRATVNAEAVQAGYARAGIPTINGQNDRAAGILEVKRRLQFEGLVVSEDCKNTIWEIGRYRRDVNSADEFAAVKKDDHLCLVAGTLIATPNGERPIEEIRPGELVWTRDGARRVLAAALTDPVARVKTITLGDGTVLTGTANHPVHVNGKFVPLGDAWEGDTVMTWRGSKLSNSGASRSGVTPTLTSTPTAPTSSRVPLTGIAALSACIGRFGRRLTGRSPRITISTTATGIPSITISAISNAFLPPTISPCMALAAGASGATSHSSLRRAVLSGSVPTTARRKHGRHRASMTNIASANSAGSVSSSTSTPATGLVPRRVVKRSDGGTSAVYSLSVADAPEYFANGVLVHNCDALRYVCMARPWAHTGTLPDSAPDFWKPGTAPSGAWLDQAGPDLSPPLGAMT